MKDPKSRSTAVKSGKGKEIPEFTAEESTRLWEWLLHEGNLYTNRVNFYIAGQSLFFVAFASKDVSIVFQIACALTGIVLSVIWLLMSQNQVKEVIGPIREVLKKQLPEYNYIASQRTPRLRTHNILGVILPRMMIVLWLVITTFEMFQ